MKLKTVPALFGKVMKIHDEKTIKFDSSGICEVKEDLGKILLEKYPDMVFDENFIPDQPKTRKQDFDQNYAETLNAEISLLKEQLKAKVDEVELVEADKEAWMSKVSDLVKERDEAVDQLNREKLSTSGEINGLKLKIELLISSVPNMQKMCEAAGFPKAEWVNLTKPEIIDYILSKS